MQFSIFFIKRIANLKLFWTIFRQNYRLQKIILYSINRQAELKRLVAWAQRKGLPGPRRCYESHLNREQGKMVLFQKRFPNQVKLAQLLHSISNLISSKPRYLPTRSASHYRLQPNKN